MLCLCTTLGQDGLTARLLVVRTGNEVRFVPCLCNPCGSIVVATTRITAVLLMRVPRGRLLHTVAERRCG